MIQVEIAAVAKVLMRSLFADVICLDDQISPELALNSEAP